MPIRPRVECTLRFSGPDSLEHNCILIYTAVGAPADQDAMVTIADNLDSHWSAQCIATITTECSYLGVRASYISDTVGYEADSGGAAAAGTVTGNTNPAHVAVLFRKIGHGPPRRARGATFWPCVPLAYTDDTAINGTGATAYQSVRSLLDDVVGAGGAALTPVVMSRKADTLYPIVSANFSTILSVQRRRRPAHT